ncbi:hypothetical protein D3C80_1577780 [compost metagenome]
MLDDFRRPATGLDLPGSGLLQVADMRQCLELGQAFEPVVGAHVERIGGDRNNAQGRYFRIGGGDALAQAGFDVAAFYLQVLGVAVFIFNIGHFVEAAEHEHRARQQVEDAEQPV